MILAPGLFAVTWARTTAVKKRYEDEARDQAERTREEHRPWEEPQKKIHESMTISIFVHASQTSDPIEDHSSMVGF